MGVSDISSIHPRSPDLGRWRFGCVCC